MSDLQKDPICDGQVRWMRRLVAVLGAASAMVMQTGCQKNHDASSETNEVAVTETLAGVTEGCISIALQNTVFSDKIGSELAASFSGQKQEGCPQDFWQQLEATGNAMHTLVQAQDAITAHNQSKDAVYQAGIAATVNDSTDHPIEDWHKRDAELHEDISVRKGAYEEASATLIAIAGRYGVTRDRPLDADGVADAAVPVTNNAAITQ